MFMIMPVLMPWRAQRGRQSPLDDGGLRPRRLIALDRHGHDLGGKQDIVRPAEILVGFPLGKACNLHRFKPG